MVRVSGAIGYWARLIDIESCQEHIHKQNKSEEHERQEHRFVLLGDTLARPGTVMVKLLDAVVAVFAVLSGHIVTGDNLTGSAVEVLTKVNQSVICETDY